MAVIVREERTIGGEKFANVKIYLSKKDALTKEERERAERLDMRLREEMISIAREAKEQHLLRLKGRPGVLPLWYFVGERLAAFVDDKSIVPAEDKEYIWRAIWDHAGDLAPGEKDKKSRKPGFARDHWRYCYLVYQKSGGSLKHAERAGTWRAWVEFIDRQETRNDDRILDWIESVMKRAPVKGWLRVLTKAIHQEFGKRHTSVFEAKELKENLERVWATCFASNNHS